MRNYLLSSLLNGLSRFGKVGEGDEKGERKREKERAPASATLYLNQDISEHLDLRFSDNEG